MRARSFLPLCFCAFSVVAVACGGDESGAATDEPNGKAGAGGTGGGSRGGNAGAASSAGAAGTAAGATGKAGAGSALAGNGGAGAGAAASGAGGSAEGGNAGQGATEGGQAGSAGSAGAGGKAGAGGAGQGGSGMGGAGGKPPLLVCACFVKEAWCGSGVAKEAAEKGCSVPLLPAPGGDILACPDGKWAVKEACQQGCVEAPAGTADSCKALPCDLATVKPGPYLKAGLHPDASDALHQIGLDAGDISQS